MSRACVNIVRFCASLLVVCALGLAVGGCASSPSRSDRPSERLSSMPVALGDARFVRWAGSSL